MLTPGSGKQRACKSGTHRVSKMMSESNFRVPAGAAAAAATMRSCNGGGSGVVALQQHISPPMSQCPLPSSSDSSPVGIPGNEDLDSELWHACAGPLISLPPVNSLVVYWPQGHLEQVANCTPQAAVQPPIPQYNLPPQILCRLTDITLMVRTHMEISGCYLS